MKNLLKLTATLGLILLLSGCDNVSKESKNMTTRSEASTKISDDMYVFCDKEKGVEYLLYKDYRAGGLTIRTNADGSVSTCK
jgi:tRNA splicing endonuclease